MAGARFVVLGLAPARSAWFRSVAQWANSASIPVEFVKCVSIVETRAHLSSGRALSALLVDAGLPGLDRDLIQAARAHGCAVIVVDDVRLSRDWRSLGADDVVNPVFERRQLVEVLSLHTSMISRGDTVPELAPDAPAPGWRAGVAMVCGPGGTGASTAAIALAQGLGDDVRHAGMVLLADLALHAEQAMLHDSRDVVPGIQELVDLHRTGRPTVEEARRLTFAVEARNYQLLLGVRRARNWGSLRARAFLAAFDTLCRGWRVVVCDADADLEGEDQGGSIEVEERHLMARTAAGHADVAFVVGLPGMKGAHAMVRVLTELLDHGVPAERIVPVLNRAPKSQRARAELASLLRALLAPSPDAEAMAGPVFLPERRVEDALRDGIRLPVALAAPLAGAYAAVAARAAGARPPAGAPEPVRPGSLGSWSPQPAG